LDGFVDPLELRLTGKMGFHKKMLKVKYVYLYIGRKYGNMHAKAVVD
jgi:hypothetical protein